MTKNDGGQAFPRQAYMNNDYSYVDQGDCGMTLRDWFAGMALQGILAKQYGDYVFPDDVSRECYSYADAMIKARGE